MVQFSPKMNTQDVSKTPTKFSTKSVEPQATQPPNAPKKLPKAPKNLPKAPKNLPNAVKCQGCEEEQPNQLAHVGPGGCLEEAFNAVYELK